MSVFLCHRCTEGWTGSSSPSPTVPTLERSLKASPRGAPLRLSTTLSPVSQATSTTGSCLRASEEIRWEKNNKVMNRLWRRGKWKNSVGRFPCTYSYSVMPQHACTQPFLPSFEPLVWIHSQAQHGCLVTYFPHRVIRMKYLSTIQFWWVKLSTLLLPGNGLWWGAPLHSALWTVSTFAGDWRSARCGSSGQWHFPRALLPDQAHPSCPTNLYCDL